MTSLIAICLLLGILLSLRANVVVLSVIAFVVGLGVFGISTLAYADQYSGACRAVVSIVSLEAGYFLGILARARHHQ